MEQKIEEIRTGDIIKTTAGTRVVVDVMGDVVLLRALDDGMDDVYRTARPLDGYAWTLLARGDWRCLPDVGWRHVR